MQSTVVRESTERNQVVQVCSRQKYVNLERNEDVQVCSRHYVNLQREMRLFRYVVDSST